ncbi:putative chitinase 18-11 protein [Phaeoacremonium minimum UCRPA7]|uniref:chitinase n=1 Tax=Phaeoacremonium minimum (strain UCR-PA7) TaxID=1286976 RepID=R8BNC8_PHAM7|nr:putative chitinase 18-11 protein [Phaeoacremonium minimum UCRPA7]EOO00898.1 putative chitinase 18-11 protein [Phaeoacremonium minimum UCRPA7]
MSCILISEDSLNPHQITAGINYVITAFANSSLFTTEPDGEYEPFMPLDEVRAMFDEGTKVCMAIGGWGDTDGFSKGAKNCTTQTLYAKSIAATLDRLGYDCVDIDWEYPGGNGADYIQHPNSEKVSEIHTYAELLGHIKAAIGDKELSIAVPGLEKDMMAFTPEQVPKINAVVDFVNVMTYDFMSRRDNVTNHHTSVNQSLHTIETYAARGMAPGKMNLGFAFYAKWFTTAEGAVCTEPVGCPTALLEAADGSDTGKSGALTFEAINFAPAPTNLTDSPDMSCGAGTFYRCPDSLCCMVAPHRIVEPGVSPTTEFAKDLQLV